jgi:hypothetical protein
MTEPIQTSRQNTLFMSNEDLLALQREKPKMPQIPQPTDLPSAIRAIQQIKEVLETRNGNRGSKVDAAVTFRDLIGSGIAAINLNGKSYTGTVDPGNGNVVPVGPQNDVTIPPSPTGLRLMGAITNVIIAWDRPNFRNFGYTEIWRSATNNLGQATMIAQTPAFTYADSIGSGAGFWYWIRHVSTANIAGPFNAQSGTYGQTGRDASYLLDVLAANPPAGVSYNPLLYVQSDPNLVIDGTPIPVGVYMNSAYIRALSVTNAQIANLAVDNAKIANLDAVKITAGDIDADRMKANIVEAATGRFNSLSALSASLGTVQINSDGWLRTAGVASYLTGNGLWMGYDAGAYKFRIGNPAGDYLTWDGTKLTIVGDLYSTGNGTFRGTFTSGSADTLYPGGGDFGFYAGPDGIFSGEGHNPLTTIPAASTWFRLDRNQHLIDIFAENVDVTCGWPNVKWRASRDGSAYFGDISVNSIVVRGGSGAASNNYTVSYGVTGSFAGATYVTFTVAQNSFCTLILGAIPGGANGGVTTGVTTVATAPQDYNGMFADNPQPLMGPTFARVTSSSTALQADTSYDNTNNQCFLTPGTYYLNLGASNNGSAGGSVRARVLLQPAF